MQVGETVYLNSGSPSLTVTAIRGKKLTVEWGNDKHLTANCKCFAYHNHPDWPHNGEQVLLPR